MPNLMFRNDGGTAVRGRDRLDRDRPPSEGARRLLRRLGPRWRPRPLRRARRCYVPGDRAYNVLFQNPGHGNHWLKVKLVGTKTNRARPRGQDPSRPDGRRRPDRVPTSDDHGRFELRRQPADMHGRPGPRQGDPIGGNLLADQPDTPIIPRRLIRSLDRDHRGG